jgi:chitosanase
MAGHFALTLLAASLLSISACGQTTARSATVSSVSLGGLTLTQVIPGIKPSGATGAIRAMSPAQKHRAEMLTSLFENNTLELQYGYAEALGDGRGITAGRAGFTSGTGDMLVIVQAYSERVHQNPLAIFLPVLQKLAAEASGSVVGLDGLIEAWAQAARDPVFRTVQDETVDTLYFVPAMVHAQELGLHSALGEAILYDTIIQHGDGSDPDGLPALIARTNALAGGHARKTFNEASWLRQFLAVRRADLANAYDPDTREVWAESVTRVDALASILAQGNMALAGPFHLHAGGFDCVIP